MILPKLDLQQQTHEILIETAVLGDQLREEKANQQNSMISCDLINQDENNDGPASKVLIDKGLLADPCSQGRPRMGRR